MLLLQAGTSRILIDRVNGPRWLAKLLIDPPWWVPLATKAIGLFVAIIVAYRLYQRDFEVSFDTQTEMQIVTAHVLAIIVATAAITRWAQLSFTLDVALGFTVGYGSVLTAQWAFRHARVPSAISEPRDRLMAVWLVLCVAGMFLPGLVGGVNETAIGGGRWILVAVAGGMTVYNAVEAHREANQTG